MSYSREEFERDSKGQTGDDLVRSYPQELRPAWAVTGRAVRVIRAGLAEHGHPATICRLHPWSRRAVVTIWIPALSRELTIHTSWLEPERSPSTSTERTR